jgi:hypothetical protein
VAGDPPRCAENALRGGGGKLILWPMKPDPPPTIDPKLLEDPVFKRVMADALAIQPRFAAEPVYAKTGKGYLKSEGVEELQRLKTLKPVQEK